MGVHFNHTQNHKQYSNLVEKKKFARCATNKLSIVFLLSNQHQLVFYLLDAEKIDNSSKKKFLCSFQTNFCSLFFFWIFFQLCKKSLSLCVCVCLIIDVNFNRKNIDFLFSLNSKLRLFKPLSDRSINRSASLLRLSIWF